MAIAATEASAARLLPRADRSLQGAGYGAFEQKARSAKALRAFFVTGTRRADGDQMTTQWRSDHFGVPVLSVGLVTTSGRSPFWPNCGLTLRACWLTSARDISPVGCGMALGW